MLNLKFCRLNGAEAAANAVDRLIQRQGCWRCAASQHCYIEEYLSDIMSVSHHKVSIRLLFSSVSILNHPCRSVFCVMSVVSAYEKRYFSSVQEVLNEIRDFRNLVHLVAPDT